ncbi:hypothetical protein SLAV_05245 [Streptomyces lavendulae subsp. lavendulae]|uniref:Uncharacterized protein n=1 Tax=Streptomyces lavendulae subsp. lavendulae TaxID=58340 RepID=A0A2K8P886_STRLA|nr:hypothetical protein SLAV_05245 [Streptomyces lavendulae subsp. lavendulae]QUQ52796.1 hypothetical protein SLLC_03285 [Streptomyces lavendulae subsp. lavendulae]
MEGVNSGANGVWISPIVLGFEKVHRAYDRIVELPSPTRSPGRPVSGYVRGLTERRPDTQVPVLIPETEPERLWQRMLQNQRGSVAAHAVRRDADAVICRLRFRVTTDCTDAPSDSSRFTNPSC